MSDIDLELISLEDLLTEVTRRSERVGYKVFYVKESSPFMDEFKDILHRQTDSELKVLCTEPEPELKIIEIKPLEAV